MLVLGKGGVGKTTVATALTSMATARELRARRVQVGPSAGVLAAEDDALTLDPVKALEDAATPIFGSRTLALGGGPYDRVIVDMPATGRGVARGRRTVCADCPQWPLPRAGRPPQPHPTGPNPDRLVVNRMPPVPASQATSAAARLAGSVPSRSGAEAAALLKLATWLDARELTPRMALDAAAGIPSSWLDELDGMPAGHARDPWAAGREI